MRFPKLRNRHICKLIVYLPAFLWILILLAVAVFEDFIPGVLVGPIYLIIVLAGCAGGVIYLLLNAIWLIGMDCLLEEIRVWKSARMWYETKRNGKDRITAEKRIRSRMRMFGRRCEITDNEVPPSEIRRKFGVSGASLYWKAIERFCMVYSVSELDDTAYRRIVSSAIRNVRNLHDESQKNILLDKARDNEPVATAVCVIVLADKISDEVTDAVIRERLPTPFGEGTVCVGDMSCGRYYFNSLREGFYLGIERKPERNYTFDIIRRIVFGGRLPLNGNDNYVLLNKRHEELKMYSEKPLWNYLKEEIQPFLKKGKKEIKNDIKMIKTFKSLSDNEVIIIGEDIYCKFNGEVTSRPFKTILSESRELTVCRMNQWVYPNKRTMSKTNMAEVEKLMEEYLIFNGYSVEFLEYDDYYEEEGDK